MSTLEQFARLVLGQHATDQTVGDLTACLHHANGAMRLNESHGLVVMGGPSRIMQPDAENFRPTILMVKAGLTPRQAVMHVTRRVGKHWRDIGERTGLGRQRPDDKTYKNWAPAATRSLARLPIGGPLGGVKAVTDDRDDPANKYQWHDLTTVPVGGVIYRVSRYGHVTAFQRLTPDHEDGLWAQINYGNPAQDFGDAAQVYADDPVAPYTSDITQPRPLLFDVEVARNVRAAAVAASGTPRG